MLNNKTFLDGLLGEAEGMSDEGFVTAISKAAALLVKEADGDEEDMKGPAPSENSVLEFIKKNPRPKDKKFHAWAEGKGLNVHKAEATAYGIISDLMHKGRSKGKHPAGVDQADVSKGVDIEKEHTPNKEIQRKITDDHNTELKKYYDPKKGLPAMEKNLEKEGGIGRIAGRAKYRWEQMQKEKKQTPAEGAGELAAFLRGKGHRVSTASPTKKGTIVKPTGALRSNLGPMPKTAFLQGFVDELEKAGYNGGAATATIRPGSTESKAMRKALKAKGVWGGKSPGILQRAAHSLRRLGKPKSTAHLKVERKPASKKETDKAISSALGGSFSSIPSLPKVAFLQGFVDELEKNGVKFGKTPGKSVTWAARKRGWKRKLLGPPQKQIIRMGRKHQANVAAAHFGGSSKDYRAAGSSQRALLKGQKLIDRRERVIKALSPHKKVGPAVINFIKRNPEVLPLVVLPSALIAGSVGAAALSKRITRAKNKRMRKKAEISTDLTTNAILDFKDNVLDPLLKMGGPPTLAKLRRAYPKGKVKPPVADPGALAKKISEFPKAANT